MISNGLQKLPSVKRALRGILSVGIAICAITEFVLSTSLDVLSHNEADFFETLHDAQAN